MTERIVSSQHLTDFRAYLIREEKSKATVEKYCRDVTMFWNYADGRPVTKELTISYKKYLEARSYAVRSINSMLASLNSLLEFMGWQDCKVKNIRLQRQTYSAEERELTKAEYQRLLEAASPQMHMVLQTICGTGIRVSELKYFTVEAAKQGKVVVNCKNKTRVILIPGSLRKKLLDYARKHQIRSGSLFITKNGRPLNRSNIWTQMKRLCQAARVNASKVFPHNLRKLFARTFYKLDKDIAKLADILGHSSINTTRIYIMTTGAEYCRKIEKMGLVI